MSEPVRDIPEEMVEKAARELFGGPHYRTKVVGGDIVEYTVTWDEAEEPGPYGRAVHRGQARRVLSAALAGRQVLPEPELIELPKFQGCNNSNPDLCACNDGPLLCTVCDYEIEDGMQAFAVTRPMRPWIPDDGPEQEWETVWWHYTCDLCPASGVHAAGSGSGED